jgi:hypothetical protein
MEYDVIIVELERPGVFWRLGSSEDELLCVVA